MLSSSSLFLSSIDQPSNAAMSSIGELSDAEMSSSDDSSGWGLVPLERSDMEVSPRSRSELL